VRNWLYAELFTGSVPRVRMPHVRNDECSRAKRVRRRERRESGVRAKIDEGRVPAAGNFGHFMGLRTPETI
jgi:hypothetical protein